MINFTESEIEVFSLAELQSIGFDFLPGPDIAPKDSITLVASVAEVKIPYGETNRASFSDVILMHTFYASVKRLNPFLPEIARQQAIKMVLSVFSPSLSPPMKPSISI